jgi:MYXO-CTERM domain-containing protein
MRKVISILSISVLGCAIAAAQADQPATSTENGKTAVANVPREAQCHDNNWGWIGLVGLAGLAGLRRRERHEVTRNDRDVEVRRVA